MDSSSKVVLTPAAMDRIVRDHLGTGLATSAEVSDGWFNTIHALTLADGRMVTLKLSPPAGYTGLRYERDLLTVEVAVHRLLASHGLAVPAILGEGSVEARTPDGSPAPCTWFLYTWLPGTTLGSARKTLSPEAALRADQDVAAQTAAVNHIRGERFGRWHPDHCASPTWTESFGLMVEDLMDDAADRAVSLPLTRQDLATFLTAAAPSLARVTTPSLVLWDLHDGNVIIDPATGALRGFLDPDRALWGDPLMEFYFRTLAAVPAHWLDAYRHAASVHGPTPDLTSTAARQRLALYDLYLALVMVIEVAYRNFPPDHEAWTRTQLAQALSRCQNILGTPSTEYSEFRLP